jgi:Skp family chaperone for outer membrane proteins
MRWIYKTGGAALGIAVAAIFLAVAPAAAQGAAKVPPPAIAVLDVQRLLGDSLASKSIRPQIVKLRSGYQKEVRKQEGELRKADQDLARQRAILAPEAYAKRRREFEQRATAAQRAVQTRKRLLDRAFGSAMGKVRSSIIEVAAEVAKERDINIVLPKSVVLLSIKSLDITGETLKRLNKRLPSVTVTLREKK